MAYKFGQFRKEQFPYSNYVKQLDKNNYMLSSIESTVEGFPGLKFSDVVIKKSFTTADGSLFIRFACTRFTRDTTISVKLTKENAPAIETNNTQNICSVLVPKGNTSEELATPVAFDILVTPNENYGQLVFSIDRDGQDFTGTPRAWIPTRTFMISSFGTISNVIPSLDIDGAGKLKQIAVQSRPGLPMCIDGEMIRVGRSGIYEINYGVDVYFIGFMPDENDHFIMDYQY